MTSIVYGTVASLLAGLMTAVGALPIWARRDISRRLNDTLLGFAAGVMLSASFFSLLVPSFEASERLYGGGTVAAAITAVGFVVGAGVIAALNELLPHEHFIVGREGRETKRLRRVWLFVLAVTIHNIPEGLAVGVGFAGDDPARATSLAVGIGLQNAPEGLAVAVALVGLGYARLHAFAIAGATGLVEPVGGFAGAALVVVSEPLLPWGLAFAAGAMIYVISHEIIPETHRHGHQDAATAGLTVGLALMMFLDTGFS